MHPKEKSRISITCYRSLAFVSDTKNHMFLQQVIFDIKTRVFLQDQSVLYLNRANFMSLTHILNRYGYWIFLWLLLTWVVWKES